MDSFLTERNVVGMRVELCSRGPVVSNGRTGLEKRQVLTIDRAFYNNYKYLCKYRRWL